MHADLPTGTVTFLFTDIEGSTRLLHSLGAEGYAEALAEHRRVIREACARYEGVEVDTQGDAFFFAFPTAPGALEAAAAFTEALASGPIQVRVGLHTGTPLFTEEGYVGDDVHFAARVAASAHGGQVILSSAAAELAETSLTDLGSHRLKDIEGAVSLYQLGAGSFPPLKTIANSNLPTPASSFMGREEELYEADLLLQATRLLTVSGPGGQGKTRFALELASRAREERFGDYRDGVFSCFLASLRDAALVLATIAQTLSVREQPGQGALDALASHLEGKRLLLLLDNAEHLLEAAPELSRLLERCAGLTLLCTSRELLRIKGELPYALPPLADEEGVSLFCERARIEPSDPIRELCNRLEGLPLAIELAAARMAILTPQQLLERLSQRLDLLKGGRDADPRQQTLRATIEWSYDLLSGEEQQLFARLSVFAGGCTLEAAEEVCDADLDTLQSLVEKSLLRFTNERYWMLETIREFAAERLGAANEPELRRRHARWYVALSEVYEPELMGSMGAQWFIRLEGEIDNIRSAVIWGLANDVPLVFSIVVNTSYFWSQTGRTMEEARLLDATWVDDVPVELRKRALRAKTGVALGANDFESMMTVSEQRLDLARATGDLDEEAAAMNMLATGAFLAGDGATARHWYDAALALHRGLDSSNGLIATLGNYGRFERDQGDLGRSREFLEESLLISRACGQEISAAFALKELGMTAIEAGAFGDAKELLIDGFDITTRLGLTVMAGDLVFAVALLVTRTEKPHEGAVLLGAMDTIDERQGFEHSPELTWWWALRDELIAALGESDFESKWSEGRALSHDDAVRYALASID